MLKSLDQLELITIPTEKEAKASWDPSILKDATFVDGVLAKVNLHGSIEVFINPTEVNRLDEEGKTVKVVKAYRIRCKNPISYGALITAAENAEYDEKNLGEISAINRKYRTDPEDPEIAVHDNFIAWIKTGLRAIGYHS